jgi:hypothetical protein
VLLELVLLVVEVAALLEPMPMAITEMSLAMVVLLLWEEEQAVTPVPMALFQAVVAAVASVMLMLLGELE